MNYLYFLVFLLLTACGNIPTPAKESPSSPFQGDSGYLTKHELLSYAVLHRVTDTAGGSSYWDGHAEGDTIAKYYRYKDGYLTCMLNFVAPYETLVLFESTADGTPEKSAQYVHGNERSCWGHSFGFGRIREYYYVRICGSGTAYSSSSLYLFRDFEQQSPEHAIYESIWQGAVEPAGVYKNLRLTSLQIDGDMVHTEYVVSKGNEVAEKEVERFKLDYVHAKGAWVADDTVVYNRNIEGFNL